MTLWTSADAAGATGGRATTGWAATGAAVAPLPVLAGCIAQAASGSSKLDASSAPAPPRAMRTDQLSGRTTRVLAAEEVAGGQAVARVDIIYSIF